MKKILLKTTNLKKLNEFKSFFDYYGIEVRKVNEFPSEIGDNYCFMKEETFLVENREDSNSINISDLKDLQSVFTYSILHYSFDGKSFESKTSSFLEGYIDLSRKKEHPDVFGWDDIFINYKLGLSLFELTKKDCKIVGRRQNMAKFAEEHLYYRDRLDLNFNAMHKDETISIDSSAYDFITSNKYLNCKSVVDSGFHYLMREAINNGVFFRSSKNRREKNYWLPGLNAGIPLVAKSDEIHEITFAVHDFTHFLLPDIIFDGESTELKKRIYIISRMMSEAITLVLADGWFVSNLKKEFNYDWDKRKIYPLFKDIDLNNLDNLKKCLYFMINYVLKGDIKYLEEITKDKEAIANFRNKYDAFFVEDYKWTIMNYENINSQEKLFEKWTTDNSSIIVDSGLITLTDFNEYMEKDLNKDRFFLDDIIDYTAERYISYILYLLKNKKNENFNKEDSLKNSFKKYMLGQMFIFAKYDFIPISEIYRKKIEEMLNTNLTKDIIDRILNLYSRYIDEIYSLDLIDSDERNIYKEIFPLFKPYFAFYDKNKEYYDSIESYYFSLK